MNKRLIRPGLLPLALFIGALIPRVWALDRGLPIVEHVDEPAIVEVVVRMVRNGDLNPHTFLYPSLCYYLFALMTRLYAWWSISHGTMTSLQDLALKNYGVTTMPMLFISMRMVTVLLGAATVPALFALGRHMFDWRAGLLGALFLLIAPFHVDHSQHITVDAATGLWVTVTLIGAWQIATTGRMRGYMLAGIAVGLAAGTKYNAGLVAVAVALAHAIFWRRALLGRSFLRLCMSGLLALLTFLATTPYALLSRSEFIRDLQFNAIHYSSGSHGDFTGRWPFANYGSFLWNNGLFPAGCIVAVAGLPVLLRRYPRQTALLLTAIVAELGMLLSFTIHFVRNILPIFPPLILVVGAATVALADLLASAILRQQHDERRDAAFTRPVKLVASRATAIRYTTLAALAIVSWASPISETLWQLHYRAQTHTLIAAADDVRHLPRGMLIAAELPPPLLGSDMVTSSVDWVTNHTLNWYRARGFRYLVANDDRRSGSDADAYDRIQADARVVIEYPPRKLGIRPGPRVVILDIGERLDLMRFLRHEMTFGSLIMLLGYEAQPGELRSHITSLDGAAARVVASGQPIQINLYWRALAPIDRDYTLFIHVIDAQGNRVAQRDLPLRYDDYETSRWQPGELVIDRADLPLPQLPPGQYRLDIGIYDPASGDRLPLHEPADATERANELMTVTISPN